MLKRGEGSAARHAKHTIMKNDLISNSEANLIKLMQDCRYRQLLRSTVMTFFESLLEDQELEAYH